VSGILIYVISERTRRGKTDVQIISEPGAVDREIAEDMPTAPSG